MKTPLPYLTDELARAGINAGQLYASISRYEEGLAEFIKQTCDHYEKPLDFLALTRKQATIAEFLKLLPELMPEDEIDLEADPFEEDDDD